MTYPDKLTAYLIQHPVLTMALGLGPLLARSTSLMSAVMLGSALLLILLCSSLTLSVCRNLIPQRFRLVFILLITSVWVSVLDMLLQAHLYQIRATLDIYVPLLAMNSLVLLVLEQEALILAPGRMLQRSLQIAVLPVLVCIMTGLLRELLVTGTITIDTTLTRHATPPVTSLPLFDTVAGAFIIAGCLLALLARPVTASSPLPGVISKPDTVKDPLE
jgi:electron transport complex protein RnfE